MSERHILVNGISKIYPGGDDDVRALDNVSLEIGDGERVGIVGPNGAGKSTLLQIIAGVHPPTTGKVKVEGKVHAILSVGMGLREEETGRENLYLDGLLLGRSREQTSSVLQKMIDFSELEDFIDQPVRTYSSGMKARLGFASLICIEPDILIIDEALSVGDAFFGAKATKAIEDLAKKGGIVIVVSHSLAAIEQMCERAVWIQNGVVRMDGTSAEVTAAYREELRERDEVDAQKQFGKGGEAWSKAEQKFRITDLSLRAERDGELRKLIETGESAILDLTVRGTGLRRSSMLRIWVERNDGLVLIDERLGLSNQWDSGRQLTWRDRWKDFRGRSPELSEEVSVSLGEIAWRPFVYQIHAEIMGPRGPVAHNAISFKVWSSEEVVGGTPVLRHPVNVEVREKEQAASN